MPELDSLFSVCLVRYANMAYYPVRASETRDGKLLGNMERPSESGTGL